MQNTTTVHDDAGAASSIHNVLPDNEWLPITGWPLKEIGSLAEVTGTHLLLMFVTRARPRWRQAVYLALAIRAFDRPDLFLRRAGVATCETRRGGQLRVVAQCLPALTPGKVLAGCFDGTPRGLMSILKKLDHEPLRPETYGLLVGWHLGHERDDARCNLLQKIVSLHQDRIDAVEALHPELISPALLHYAQSKAAADRLNETLQVVRALCSHATFDAIQKSVRDLQGVSTISNWTEAWLRSADRLQPPPFDGDEHCRPITNGPALDDLARRFKNCLSSRYMASILSGKIAVVEYTPEPALALLSRLSNGHWLFVSTHSPGNRPVNDQLAGRVRDKVMSFGPHIHALHQPDPKTMQVLQQCFGGFEPFDLEWEALAP